MDPNSKAGWALFLFKAFCASVILITMAFTTFTVGPSIETRYRPAVSKLRILAVAPDSEGGSLINAEFTKLRGECEYIGITWSRRSADGTLDRVPVILLRREGDTSSPNRPVGTQRAGPWSVGIPPEAVRGESVVALHHRCHPFWTSRTDFYP